MNPIITYSDKEKITNKILKFSPYMVYSIDNFYGPYVDQYELIYIKVKCYIDTNVVYRYFQIEIEFQRDFSPQTIKLIFDKTGSSLFSLTKQELQSLYDKKLKYTRKDFNRECLSLFKEKRIDMIYDYLFQYKTFFSEKMKKFNAIYKKQSTFYLGV